MGLPLSERTVATPWPAEAPDLLRRSVANVASRLSRLTIPRRIAYPVLGLVATVAAPSGLLFVRLSSMGGRWPGLREEILDERATYLYLTLAAMLVFVGLGTVLGHQADRLLALSATDDLTGLHNRWAFQRRLDEEIPRSARGQQPLSVLMLDLDGFKGVNDRWGHLTGDALLRAVGHAIHTTLRNTDFGARWGGDEFGIVAPDTSPAAASVLAQRLRTAIEAEARRLRQPLTASVGVGTFVPHHPAIVDRTTLVKAADTALYEAKRSGGNGVRSAKELPVLRPGHLAAVPAPLSARAASH